MLLSLTSSPWADTVWLWVLVAAASASVLLALYSRIPLLAALESAGRDLRAALLGSADAERVTPTWIHAGVIGSSGLVGAATAVGLGGTGALVWLWAFAIVAAPIAGSAVLLARTAPAGRASGVVPGTVAARARSETGLLSHWGKVVWLFGMLGALFLPFLQATSLAEMSATIAGSAAVPYDPPGRAFAIGSLGVAIVFGLALMFATNQKLFLTRVANWVSLLAFFAVVFACLIAISSNMGMAIGSLTRAMGDAVSGAPEVGAFSGASAREVFAGACGSLLAAFLGTIGIVAGATSRIDAPTKRVALFATASPILSAVFGTLVVLAVVATGSFHKRRYVSVDMERAVTYAAPFETVSQRLEDEGRWKGAIRTSAGGILGRAGAISNSRSSLEPPNFSYYGKPADIAVTIEDGKVTQLLRPAISQFHELKTVDISNTRRLRAMGRGVPEGSALFGATFTANTSDSTPPIASYLILVALIVFCGAAFALSGLAFLEHLGHGSGESPAAIRVALGALPMIFGSLAAMSSDMRFIGPGVQIVMAASVVSLLGVCVARARASALLR